MSSDEDEDSQNSPTPSTSSAKRYDPNNCKKKRKLSAAKMQEKDIKMKEDRQAAFFHKLNSIQGNPTPSEDKDGDQEFGNMVTKEMRLVCELFCNHCYKSVTK